MLLKIKKTDIFLFAVLCLYRVCLDLQYGVIISFLYAYDGYTKTIITHKVVLSWLMTLLLSIELVRLSRKRTMSSLFLFVLGLLYFIPGFSLYAMFGQITDSYISYYAGSCLMLYMVNWGIPYFKMSYPSEKRRKQIFKYIVVGIAIISLVIMGVYNGFRVKVSLTDVYDLRDERTNMHIPVFVNYFQPMSAMLVPICMIFFMLQKKWLMFAFMVLLQLMSFAFGGLKATFFAIVIATCAIFYPRGKRYLIAIAILLFSMLALVEFYGIHTSLMTEVITRRISFVPNMLGYFYYDFFSTHELLYWRSSVLRFLGFENPYHMYIPRLIGEIYYGRVIGCNTGMFGEAFAHFGWFSIVLYPLLYIISFRFFDACTKGIDERITLTAVALLSISFIDVAFWGVMLTEGFILLCICCYYMPRLNENTSCM